MDPVRVGMRLVRVLGTRTNLEKAHLKKVVSARYGSIVDAGFSTVFKNKSYEVNKATAVDNDKAAFESKKEKRRKQVTIKLTPEHAAVKPDDSPSSVGQRPRKPANTGEEKRRQHRTKRRTNKKALTLAALKRFTLVRLTGLCAEYGIKYKNKNETCPALLDKMKEADAAWV